MSIVRKLPRRPRDPQLSKRPYGELESVPISTALIDIARPLFDALTPDAPISDYQRTLVTARLAWNFAVSQELGRPMDPSKLGAELSNDQGGREVLVALAARKRMFYPRDRRLVMTATLSRSGADFELSTACVAALDSVGHSAKTTVCQSTPRASADKRTQRPAAGKTVAR